MSVQERRTLIECINTKNDKQQQAMEKKMAEMKGKNKK